MTGYIIRRMLAAFLIMFIVATVVFFSMRIIPGDPAVAMLGPYASEEALTSLRTRIGLHLPLQQQYFVFITGLFRGDLGVSMVSRRPIVNDIVSLLPLSIELALVSMIMGSLIGIPIGVLTAIRKNTLPDFVGRIFALLGFSMPAFFLGVILLLVFSVNLSIFPIIHQPQSGGGLWDRFIKLFLPSLSLGLIQASFVTRMGRATMLEILNKDYIRTAHAKGLSSRIVHYKHGLRNALIPLITAIGLYTGPLLGGAILTETVFNRPGLGRLLIGAIRQRDYTMIQSGLLVFAGMVVIVNMLVDLSYVFIDPRVKYN